MHILWFSPTPSLYTDKTWGHNGGGWISALENILKLDNSLSLAVAFEYEGCGDKTEIGGVMYYPMNFKKNIFEHVFTGRDNCIESKIKKALLIIQDFNPDIIQLFGSESWYGLLCEYVDIPTVIHVQGSLPSYYNARYPAGISVWDKVFSAETTLMQKMLSFRMDSTFKKKAAMEERILKINKYFMGRTHWDRAIVSFYNPDAKYFICNESIRSCFMSSENKWKYPGNATEIDIMTTISGPLYKGMDLVLKTAFMLKTHTNIKFNWYVCGVSECKFIENKFGIKASDVNIHLMGILSDTTLHERLRNAMFYVHPSYIDNSPNSVCEAQLVGIPVIATNVGGVSSLVEDCVTGFLVPANDPLMIASLISSNYSNKELLKTMSLNEISVSKKRHDPAAIKEQLMSIYSELSGQQR